jgi:hypothetical protein
MATMKLTHDPNADRSLDNMSREELRREVMHQLEELERLGVFLNPEPPGIKDQATSEAAE